MSPNLQMGVVGNCQVASLIDGEGTVMWCCLPRPDGDPVFSALLTAEGRDAAQGIFRVELARHQRAAQRYLHNTAVLETTLTDAQENVVRITDFCPRFRDRGRIFRLDHILPLARRHRGQRQDREPTPLCTPTVHCTLP